MLGVAAAACFLFLSSLAPAKPGGGRSDIGATRRTTDDEDPWVLGTSRGRRRPEEGGRGALGPEKKLFALHLAIVESLRAAAF